MSSGEVRKVSRQDIQLVRKELCICHGIYFREYLFSASIFMRHTCKLRKYLVLNLGAIVLIFLDISVVVVIAVAMDCWIKSIFYANNGISFGNDNCTLLSCHLLSTH